MLKIYIGTIEHVKITTTVNLINPIIQVGTEGVTMESGGIFLQGRTIYLSDYYLARYETTYIQLKKVCYWAKDNGYSFANEG